MEKPKFMEENYHYYDEDYELKIKENAPKWAKEEYKEFMKLMNPTVDEEGCIKLV